MTLLILGAGGREHALAWRLSQDPGGTTIICAPGNPGIGEVASLQPLAGDDPDAAVGLATHVGADLTIVGPEVPLSRGVVDRFSSAGLPIVGPTQAAAALETSKTFAKAFMTRHGVPTAAYHVSDSAEDAVAFLTSGRFGFPVVVKADGLAAGKGVVVAPDAATAHAAVTAMMRERRFGEAGDRVVIEEYLEGPELSYFVLSDGERVLPLGSAQDHKRAYDGDAGPNTGGMGAFAPSPRCDAALESRILGEIVGPVIAGMREEGHPYRGFLYCGLMLTSSGPRVIEFNVRLGDPEAQVLLPLIEGNLSETLTAAAAGALGAHPVRLASACTVGIVLASGGYPDAYQTGKRIEGLHEAASLPHVTVFHAGTALGEDGQLVTAGGRVMTVVARGDDYAEATSRAYQAVDCIRFEGMHVRRDIGLKAE